MPRDPLDDNDWRLHNDHFCATMDECVHRRLFVARSAAIRASYGAKTVLTRQRLFIERVAVNGLVWMERLARSRHEGRDSLRDGDMRGIIKIPESKIPHSVLHKSIIVTRGIATLWKNMRNLEFLGIFFYLKKSGDFHEILLELREKFLKILFDDVFLL